MGAAAKAAVTAIALPMLGRYGYAIGVNGRRGPG
jgi:hypothetical protein